MSVRTRAALALLVVGLLALGAAGPATAKGHRKLLQPLNQYVVSGKVNTDELARAGFDLNEASVTGKKGRFFIVATARQARRLDAQKGVRVRSPHGRRARTAAVAAPSPVANPTHGYNVFRPWSLKPAACPGTCATPLKPLKEIYQDIARANPDVVKREVIGHSVLGQDIVAYKVTRDARDLRDGARPAVLYDSTSMPASGSPPRSSAGSSPM